MTLRNKLVKYTKRNGPPTRYQYEHLLAIGNLKKASYDMERSDILRRFAELFDDEMIRSNKLSKIPADQHSEYDRQIAKARRRIHYMNNDIHKINCELGAMIRKRKAYNERRKSCVGRACRPQTKMQKHTEDQEEVTSEEESDVLFVKEVRNPNPPSKSNILKSHDLQTRPNANPQKNVVDLTSTAGEELESLYCCEPPLEKLLTKEKAQREPQNLNSLSEFARKLLRRDFRFDLTYRVRSRSLRPRVFSYEYEQYLIKIIREMPDDEKKEIQGDSIASDIETLMLPEPPKKKREVKDEFKEACEKNMKMRAKRAQLKEAWANFKVPEGASRKQMKRKFFRKRGFKTNRMKNEGQQVRKKIGSGKRMRNFNQRKEHEEELREFREMSHEFLNNNFF